MSSSIQQSRTSSLLAPSSSSFSEQIKGQLKELCYRLLSPIAETAADREVVGWEEACLKRADELGAEFMERFSLFVGLHREGLLVANILANRHGASLSELQAFGRGMIWMSGQVKEAHALRRVLVILPVDPQFGDAEIRCIEAALAGAEGYATSAAPGAPLLPLETVSALSNCPRRSHR